MYPAKKYYRLNTSEEVIWERLETMIDVQSENTIKNHFKNVCKNRPWLIAGKINEKKATFWRLEGVPISIPGLIHSCEIVKIGNERLFKLSTSYSKLFLFPMIVIGIFYWYGCYTEFLSQSSSFISILLLTFICFILYLMLHTVPIAIFWSGNKDMNLDLEDYLDLKKVKVKYKK